ncbi:MAG: recombinase family protein [Clostridia bacterium]|nr:recombinase family protein [Clostridia bacterium]
MIDTEKREIKQKEKEKTRRRMRVEIDPENYEYTPASKKQADYYDDDVNQRVAIYVRVSTDDVRQTTSFELQKKYYEDFVVRHPNWTLVKIYADEGISGTSLAHRNEFNQMIADCKASKIDLIITKSVSRFARNVLICIGMVRDLAELKPPVGVFFESECIFSLNDDSQMALSFQATMAEEESHTRSRSMETSLRMRLDNGIPLTPKLLGYSHDTDGNLIINQDEAPTVKLAFYMYLYGYSTQQIADALISLGRRSYLGNIKWTPGGIIQILRNERHCGDVVTRKTFTPNYHTHLSRRNNGDRPQSHYKNHHEAIISRDDFIAVQRMLDNAKYGNKSYLPSLKVIDSGILKGFVTVNPRWAGFKEPDYYQAAQSVCSIVNDGQTQQSDETKDIQIEVNEGDFDMRGFEITRSEFFDSKRNPAISFSNKKIKLSSVCVKKFKEKNYIELLINPLRRMFAIRSTSKDNRQGIYCSKLENGEYQPKEISAAAFIDIIYSLMDWNPDCKYRIIGTLFENKSEIVYLFDSQNSEAFFKSYVIPKQDNSGGGATLQPLTPSGKRIRAIPEEWTTSFGKEYYLHEQTLMTLSTQSESDWRLRVEGQFFETDKKLQITSFDKLKDYIQTELKGITQGVNE